MSKPEINHLEISQKGNITFRCQEFQLLMDNLESVAHIIAAEMHVDLIDVTIQDCSNG